MGPIILSLNYMMKDVLLFLITFTVIMLAFASGVAYIFNMAAGLILLNRQLRSIFDGIKGSFSNFQDFENIQKNLQKVLSMVSSKMFK